MATKLICDTNVFYNIGLGKLDAAAVEGAGERICYSPVVVLELAGKWSDRTHGDRKAASQAILDTSAQELPDPESFLTTLFGYELEEPPFSFKQAVLAMSQSVNMEDLRAGVRDYPSGLVRRVSISAAASWRTSTEEKWVDDMLTVMKAEIPKFESWYERDPAKRKPTVPRLRGKDKESFLAGTQTFDWFMDLLSASQYRAFGKAKRASVAPSKEQVPVLLAALEKAACFGAVYTQYLIRALTEGALPEQNDSGDIELFNYAIDDDHVVVTSEKKWIRMARKAGYESRVRQV